ncbi:MAG: hypothetical protein IT335_14890 [Thermomicrobiales bacterium]|nr:hypothetical protein [Thermomicrobiales bacterium]
MSLSWSWLSLIALGSFHGLNPAMGWLFAVALGIQERRVRGVVHALGPIAAGHAVAISAVALVVWLAGTFIPRDLLMVLGGVSMLLFAGHKIMTRFRHTTWVGMRVKSRDLVAWSFLMATAHGAGLMLVPTLLKLRDDQVPSAVAQGSHAHHLDQVTGSGDGLAVSLLAVGLHTAAMFTVAGTIAVVVYKKVGVDVLRRAWINLDLVWAVALITTGLLTLSLAFYQIMR